MKRPKEDPEDKANRLRERRLSLLEQKDTTEESAQNLTQDLRAIYGLGGLKNKVAAITKPVTPISPLPSRPSLFSLYNRTDK